MLTAHERATVTINCHRMASMQPSTEADIKDIKPLRMKQHEHDVQSVCNAIKILQNPFKKSTELRSLGSGIVAPQNVQNDIEQALAKGEEAIQTFIAERIASGEKDFHSPLKKLQLKSFTSLNKTVQTKTKTQNILLQADRQLYARLIITAQSRKMKMQDVLKYSLGPLPYSIAQMNGNPVKTDKAKLTKAMPLAVFADVFPDNVPHIVDFMAVLHSITKVSNTFGDLAKNYSKYDLTWGQPQL